MKIPVKTNRTEKVYATPDFWDAGHSQRVEAALASVNGRAQSFALTTYGAIRDVVCKAEERLDNLGVSKKNQVGAELTFTPSGPKSNCYNHAAISTKVTLSRTTGGWFLTGVERDLVRPMQSERLQIALSREGCEQVVAVAMHDIVEIAEKVQ